MGTFLFDDIIFGPVDSRRLGTSLGINLLPTTYKICNFNCIYCECGLTEYKPTMKSEFPGSRDIHIRLETKLKQFSETGRKLDSITFAGNGEPTLHPEFGTIINSTVELRNQYCPEALVSVLTNATHIHRQDIRDALDKTDQNIIKLDSAFEETVNLINCPKKRFVLDDFLLYARSFKNKPVLQTMFFRGTYKNQQIDNTKREEIAAWLHAIKKIKPKLVMIYTIARNTPIESLHKISEHELEVIADLVKRLDIPVHVSG